MKKNAMAKAPKVKTAPKANTATDDNLIQKTGNTDPTFPAPNYSSMYREIEKISDPVSFELLKAFYGLDLTDPE